MKLQELPLLMRAFTEIELDNSGIYARQIIGMREVPKRWHNAFLTTEGILMCASERKVPKRVPQRAGGYAFVAGEDTLADMIVACADDSQSWALKKLGCSNKVAAMVSDVLEHFFDGTLSETFTGPRPEFTPKQVLRRGRY